MTPGRLPKGIDLLADIRRQGFRPDAGVFVFVNANRPRPRIYSDVPLDLEVCVRSDDRIDRAALWPLADLDIHLHAPATTERFRDVARAVIAARPRFVIGAIPDEGRIFKWSPSAGWSHEILEVSNA